MRPSSPDSPSEGEFLSTFSSLAKATAFPLGGTYSFKATMLTVSPSTDSHKAMSYSVTVSPFFFTSSVLYKTALPFDFSSSFVNFSLSITPSTTAVCTDHFMTPPVFSRRSSRLSVETISTLHPSSLTHLIIPS